MPLHALEKSREKTDWMGRWRVPRTAAGKSEVLLKLEKTLVFRLPVTTKPNKQ